MAEPTSSPAAPLGGRRTARGLLATADGPKVSRPAPLRQVVYDAIAELIVAGTLEPGQHLVEAELAEYLGVSRQPVREALQRLQTEGWVDLRPAQGAFVHRPTTAEVDQLLSVRIVLETYSATEAATKATADDVRELLLLQEAGMDALGADDVDGLVTANARLHAHITKIADNAVLAGFIAQVDRRVRWYYTPIARPRGQEAWSEHARLIEAISRRDSVSAGRIMTEHTETTRLAYLAQSGA